MSFLGSLVFRGVFGWISGRYSLHQWQFQQGLGFGEQGAADEGGSKVNQKGSPGGTWRIIPVSQ